MLKCPDLCRKVIVANPPPPFSRIEWSVEICTEGCFHAPISHEGADGGGRVYRNILLGIEWNFQICTENSCLPTPTTDEWGQFTKVVFATYWVNYPDLHRKFICHPITPFGVGVGYRSLYKICFARNWMKCPNLDRKVMYTNQPSYGLERGRG